jgi:glycine cleavage system aminomethyltransferase T
VSLEFLSPGAGALARSPMEREALAAGARLEHRDGWNVAARFDSAELELRRCTRTVGFADLSHIGKVELQADADELAAISGERLELGRGTPADGAWWCPYTPERAIVLCGSDALPGLRGRLEERVRSRDGLASVIDVTTSLAALTLLGPLAREVFARFSAIDLRPASTSVGGFRPGSVGRTPGAVLRVAEDRYLMLFGSAVGSYMWTVVADAAGSLGGGPVGVDALAEGDEPVEEASARA